MKGLGWVSPLWDSENRFKTLGQRKDGKGQEVAEDGVGSVYVFRTGPSPYSSIPLTYLDMSYQFFL